MANRTAAYQIRSTRGRKEIEQIFVEAVVTGNVPTAKSCIDKGVDPNVLAYDAMTPLHIAAEKDDTAIGKLLMDAKNIQLNRPLPNGDTPLIYATKFRHRQFVRLLLDIKSDKEENEHKPINEKTDKLKKVDLTERKFGKLWFHRGANPNIRNNLDKTALHIATILGLYDIAKDLIEAGADVNVADTFGNTPLTYCVLEHPNTKLARFLLAKGANPNFWTCRPNALFLETALNCCSPTLLDMMEILINYGIDVDIVNAVTQFTALHMVGISGYVPLAKLLLSKNANLFALDCINRTPYDIAVAHEHKDLVKLYNSVKEAAAKKSKKRKIHFAVQ